MKKLFLSILVIFVTFTNAQDKTSVSPYSKYGFGDPRYNSSAITTAMGDIYANYNAYNHINFRNPASYSKLTYTVYNMAVATDFYKLENYNYQNKEENTYFSRAIIGLPIVRNKVGLAFGFMPYFSKGYKYTLGNKTFESSGGLNDVFLGASYNVYKGLRFGFNVNYLFGKTEESIFTNNTNTSLYSEEGTFISNKKGLSYDIGAQYKHKLDKKLSVNIGATYSFEANLDDEPKYVLIKSGINSINKKDTIFVAAENIGVKKTIKLPSRRSFAFGVEKDQNWSISTQLQIDNYSKFESNDKDVKYQDAYRVSLGGWWVPRHNSFRSYWSRVTYRFGGYYDSGKISVYDKDIKEFGINFGLGLPVGRDETSSFNLGFSLGQKGTSDKQNVFENFAKIKLSFSFSDIWFRKRKYD